MWLAPGRVLACHAVTHWPWLLVPLWCACAMPCCVVPCDVCCSVQEYLAKHYSEWLTRRRGKDHLFTHMGESGPQRWWQR